MNLRELFLDESQIWARSGNKIVRKYRCTSGPRKNRVVSKYSQCFAPINVKASQRMKRTQARRKPRISYKSKLRKSYSPIHKRLTSYTKSKR